MVTDALGYIAAGLVLRAQRITLLRYRQSGRKRPRHHDNQTVPVRERWAAMGRRSDPVSSAWFQLST